MGNSTMNKKIKTKWLKALRSGNYTRGKNQLKIEAGESHHTGIRNIDRFCCLGVLCEISGVSYKKYAAFPPNDFLTKIGLDELICDQLAKKNDEKDLSFKKIASWIENNL